MTIISFMKDVSAKLDFFLCFYRIKKWRKKGSWPKLLGYTLLGYGIAAHFEVFTILINTILIIGIFMYAFSVNDFFDFLLLNDENFIGEKIKTAEIAKEMAFIYCHLPLISLILLLLIKRDSALLALSFFLIAMMYSTLPWFKDIRTSFVIPAIVIPINFAQAHTLLNPMSATSLMLAVLVFLNAFRGEVLGVIRRREWTANYKRKLTYSLKVVPLFSLILSLTFAILGDYVFIITSFFSIARYTGLKNISEETNFSELEKTAYWRRLRLFGLPEGMYEFGLYAILGLLHLF